MESLSWLQIVLLVLAAFCAGTVDAIAGGGGLLTLPVLLSVGLPPQQALGTNKGQSVFGSFAALLRYRRAGLVDGRLSRVTFPAGILGAAAGAALVLLLDPGILRPVVLVLLVAAGAVVALRRPREQPSPVRPVHWAPWAAGIALTIGAYDGFFGPGTGTFLILAFSALLGSPLPKATADAKVVNFASNLAAVALFASRGVVLWAVALPMAGGQALGGWVGAHLAVRGGAAFIRWVVLAVVVGLVAKLSVDVLRA